MTTRRIIALVAGCVLLLPGLGMLLGGGAVALAYATQRNDDGYFDVRIERLETTTVAITGEDLDFTADPGSPDWVIDAIDLDVQLRATSLGDGEIFVGIARQEDLDAFLAGVAHDRVTDLDDGVDYERIDGSDVVGVPIDQDFWVASAVGPGTQEITWEATSGQWGALLMNADGSPGVSAAMDVGARSDIILPLAIGLVVVGSLLTAGAVVLIVVGASGARRRDERADDEASGNELPPPVVSSTSPS
ncbi:MAG TPA: hypothetical protein VK853_00065 [Ilumatobacteraceae bacterium]|nr:hypothetical protein [Ilumatobacteraceae bacterium]